ncbi:MAG TPA: helix-turn-helix domain-containing protein [Nocardioidaceae bacterium]|nr:helix-turn-helix domain-containing protein [Nocardioidaceae bacterium]
MTDLLSTPDAGRLLGVTRSTVASWIRSGQLDAVRDGRNYKVRRSDVLARRDAAVAGHGRECQLSTDPFRSGVECSCVACYCGEGYVRGWMGSCARCYRPLVRDGRVVR